MKYPVAIVIHLLISSAAFAPSAVGQFSSASSHPGNVLGIPFGISQSEGRLFIENRLRGLVPTDTMDMIDFYRGPGLDGEPAEWMMMYVTKRDDPGPPVHRLKSISLIMDDRTLQTLATIVGELERIYGPPTMRAEGDIKIADWTGYSSIKQYIEWEHLLKTELFLLVHDNGRIVIEWVVPNWE